MRTERSVIFLAVLAGIGIWIVDAVFDYLWFHDDTFLRLLILAPPAHEMYIRLIILVSFAFFGVIAAGLIAKRIMETWGGRSWIESEGRGTYVCFTLPKSEARD
jgi:hypothetical protein